MKEIWKDIKGYEGDYQVSNMGNVRSLRFNNNGPDKKGSGVRNLKLILNSVGYYVVSLYKNKILSRHFVHRLVAETFIPNPQNKPCIDHIDTEKTNNAVSNLRWCTIKENINNPISSKRRLAKCREQLCGKFGKYSLKHRRIIQYSKDMKIVRVWEAMSDACRELHLDSGCLTKACQGKQKTTGGYYWKYANQ